MARITKCHRGTRMSITIIWNTLNRCRTVGGIDLGQPCYVCEDLILPHSLAIRDIQSTDSKKYFHPTCFLKGRREQADRILRFWSQLVNEGVEPDR